MRKRLITTVIMVVGFKLILERMQTVYYMYTFELQPKTNISRYPIGRL